MSYRELTLAEEGHENADQLGKKATNDKEPE